MSTIILILLLCLSFLTTFSPIDLQSHATPKRPRLDQSIIPKAKAKAVQELSVGFVIDSDVPFTIFEHKFLKELFYQFDHELAL
jgi:hypothetical protein